MTFEEINSFLKFGYFLGYKNNNYSISFDGIDKIKYNNANESELIDEGISRWKNCIHSQFENRKKHVVPLSGGLDSRAILGALLELTDAENIYTYTFGTPKTYDYEIGRRIAKKTGTRHTQLEFSDNDYSTDDLIQVSKRVDHQTLLFLHPHMKIVDELFSDHAVWSGTIIDVYFGRHTHELKANSWDEAIKNSFRENIFVSSLDITNIPDSQMFKLVDVDDSVKNELELEHIIDLRNRQLKFIAPHVLMKGYDYKVLFQDADLTGFALSMDSKLIDDQFLYKKMMLRAFPTLFSLPTKSNYGLPLNASIPRQYARRFVNKLRRNLLKQLTDPNTNYLNFNQAIRERSDLRKVVYENVMDLKNRQIVDWIDIDKIWNSHNRENNNHADALITLASLEIHIKAGLDI